MFKRVNAVLLWLLPTAVFAICEPVFERPPHALARAWGPQPPSLPAVGDTAVWPHPTHKNGHHLRIHSVADPSTLKTTGIEPEALNTRHEYSQHSAFSATGRWLISHGNTQRVLFDGMQYTAIRAITREHRIADWQWDPKDDNIAYYMALERNAVMRYDVKADKHEPILTADTVAHWIETDRTLTLEGNHGQGATSASGDRMAAKFATGDDAIVVVFDPRSRAYIAHAEFPGLAGQRKMDWQGLSPSGDKLLVQGHFDALYKTAFADGNRNQQVRIFDVDSLDTLNGQLVIGRASHFDFMRDSRGREFFVIAGSQPPDGWKGKRERVRGLVQGLYTVDLETLAWRQRLNFRKRFKNGVPAVHVSASPNTAQVLLSFYQGGNEDSAIDAQNSPMLFVDLDNGWNTRVAWFGWDLSANPGLGGSAHGYLAQPHASHSTNVWFANGERGMKAVWASDNNTRDKLVGNMVVAELECPANE